MIKPAVLSLILVMGAQAHASTVILRENAKPGTLEWRISSTARNREIEGYASHTSVNRGEQIRIYVNTDESTYTIEIFRLGWYGSLGGRRMTDAVTRTGVSQPMPTPDPTTGLIECRWTDPYLLSIPKSEDPAEWASGIYVGKLTAGTSRKQAFVIFVVRDDDRRSDLLFQSSVTTFQAYNNWGGKSLYAHNSTGPESRKVSFDRPYVLTQSRGAGQFLDNGGWEYNMVRWLEKEGYDVTYATNIDTHTRLDIVSRHGAFLSVGHDEYWSWEMRSAVELIRDRGIHLGFFSANTCYWQIRLEPNSSGEPYRVMVCYKENVFAEDPLYLDNLPQNDHLLTTKWHRWPILNPEERFIGVMFIYNPVNADIVISNADHWAFEKTGLRNGDRLPGLLGYEVDRVHGNSPPGLQILATSPFQTQDGKTEVSHMTVYQAASGAYVFATGTIQWSWGLDDYNSPDSRTSRLSPAAQQITRNVLSRFGAQRALPRARTIRR